MEHVKVALAHRPRQLHLAAEQRGADRLAHPRRRRAVARFLQPQREVARGRIGAVRGKLRRHRPARHQPAEIERPARLRPGAGKPAPAERLHAHHRADHVAVDVDVADLHPRRDMRDRLVEARMQAEGEAVAGGVDRIDQPVQPRAAEAHDVQHRAEHLARQVGDIVKLDDRRRHEGAVRGFPRQPDLLHRAAEAAHPIDMLRNIRLGFGGDDRADIDRQPIGPPDRQFVQRALDHVERAVGDILLQAQDAQRRATLPRAVEGGGDHVRHHLLGERGGIDDHRILAAGLRDQRDRRAIGGEARRQLALDQPRHLGRSGEHHRRRLRRGDQRSADRAVAGQQLQHVRRHARLMQDRDALRGDQRGFLGRLGQYRIARDQCRRHLPGEDRQREVPRADARHRPQRAMRRPERAPRLIGIIMQEVDRLAHLPDGIGQRLAGLAHDQPEQRRHPLLHDRRRAIETGGAIGRRHRRPCRSRRQRPRRRGARLLRRRLDHRADTIAMIGGIEHRPRRALPVRRHGAPCVGRARAHRLAQRGERAFIAQVQPGGIGPRAI